MEPLITVFTPTYNRLATLKRLYNSLVLQTSQNFKWLIVDDGSTDKTERYVLDWITDGRIDIEYYKQENQGKMMAHNKGVELTITELFMCIDSDDWIVKYAIESICDFWNNTTYDDKCAGIIAYRGKTKTEVIGTKFVNDVSQSSLSYQYNKGFTGDTTLIFKTGIIKKYPFLYIPGEKFITEAYVYDQIDQCYYYHLMPQIITVCEYRTDGYTKNGMKIVLNNPGGWAVYCMQQGNFSRDLLTIFKKYGWSVSYRLMYRKKIDDYIKPTYRCLYCMSVPLGIALYIRRKIKYGCQI